DLDCAQAVTAADGAAGKVDGAGRGTHAAAGNHGPVVRGAQVGADGQGAARIVDDDHQQRVGGDRVRRPAPGLGAAAVDQQGGAASGEGSEGADGALRRQGAGGATLVEGAAGQGQGAGHGQGGAGGDDDRAAD